MTAPYDTLKGYFGSTMAKDLLSLVTDELIGVGSARQVYGLAINPLYVIKFEIKAKSFQNVAEWDIWHWVSGTDMAHWFAPCRMISECGTVLVQDRVQELREEELPKKLPAYLCDLKPENFGLLNGRVVACDYGTVGSALRRTSKRLVKAEWRTGDTPPPT